MNIEQHINKLPHLDRIEFRQKLDNCETRANMGLNGLWCALIIVCILGISGHIEIAIKLISLLFLLLFVTGIEFCLIILSILITNNRKRKLYETYFKLEVKKKK